MTLKSILPAIAALAIWSVSAPALEIDPTVIPEINIGGRLIVTPIYEREEFQGDDPEDDFELEVDDSSILFDFAKYLFTNEDYGFAVLGLRLPEDDSEVDDDLFVHEAHVGLGGSQYELKLGRSQLTNTLVQFPTLRDDDLLEFTHVLNGRANADAEEFQVFGGVLQGSWWFTPAVSLTGAITSRIETDEQGDRTTSTNLNGGSIGLAYWLPETIKFDRGLRFAGITADYQDLDELAGLSSDEMVSVIAGLTYNLSDNPEATLVLDGQAIYNNGADEVTDLAEEVGRARAESTAVVAALRYLHRPWLQTRWQAALTLGWKDYHDFDDATAFTVAPSLAYRLGSGIDFLAQYRYRHNDDGLASAIGVEDEHTIAVGLSFAFDHTFNETVGERGSILNIEHQTLDFGPVGGGH